MIYLYKNAQDKLGDKIVDKFLSISLAHKVVEIDDAASYLMENEIVIKGEAAIFRFLEALSNDLEYSRSLSADACIMDDRDGSIC